MAAKTYSDFALYRRMLRIARPYWPHIGVVFLISLLATPLALATPLGLKIAVDSAIGDQAFGPSTTLATAICLNPCGDGSIR